MSGFHRPFRQQDPAVASPTESPLAGSQEREEIIDPNLYGPFGHRYHDDAADEPHHATSSHRPHPSNAEWHDVETTEQHRRHASQEQSYSAQISSQQRQHQPQQHHHQHSVSLSQSQSQSFGSTGPMQRHPYTATYNDAALGTAGVNDSEASLTKWTEGQGDIPLRSTASIASHSSKPFLPYAAPMSVQYSQDTDLKHGDPYGSGDNTIKSHGTHGFSRFSQHHGHGHGHGHHETGKHSRAGSLFDLVHGKHGKEGSKQSTKPHIAEYGEDVPINFRHLFKRPVIRQWLHGNRLYREKDERKASQFELVFDLIFVAVVNGLGHATAESNSAINVLKFVLSFWPCFSIWTDVRLFLNVSGTDDVLERLLLLGWMVLLCGYCANISGVELVYATPQLLEALHSEELVGDAPAQHQEAGLLGELQSFIRRAGSSAASSEEVKLSTPAFGGYWFTEGYERAIHAAISFFLVAKLWRLGIYMYYGFALPKFRKALWLNALAMACIAGIYIPITLTDSPLLITILMAAGIIVEMARAYVVAAAMKLFHRQSKRRGDHIFIPAQSHEHSMERYVLFVILIVGESIISSTFVAAPGHYGLNSEFGRASLGIAISVLVIWTYYDADGSRVYQHALKRNSFTSITFCHIHYPLTAALILMASSLSTLVSNNEVHGGYMWYFGGSLSAIMVCLGLIGMMHRNLDKHGSTLVPRWGRILVRFMTAVVFATLPIKGDWNTLQLMGVTTAILVGLVAFETLGKIGAVGRRYDPDLSAQLYANMEKSGIKNLKLERRASWHPFDDLTPGEQGEEDVGIESEIGHLEEKDLIYGQRWAYAA